MKMSTPNQQVEGRALSATQPLPAPEPHVSSYENSVAHAPQHNGHTYINFITSAGILDSSAIPSNNTSHPRSLRHAREQLQVIGTTHSQPHESPGLGTRPGPSSRQSSSRKQPFRRYIFLSVPYVVISGTLSACIYIITMLIFNARNPSL